MTNPLHTRSVEDIVILGVTQLGQNMRKFLC